MVVKKEQKTKQYIIENFEEKNISGQIYLNIKNCLRLALFSKVTLIKENWIKRSTFY